MKFWQLLCVCVLSTQKDDLTCIFFLFSTLNRVCASMLSSITLLLSFPTSSFAPFVPRVSCQSTMMLAYLESLYSAVKTYCIGLYALLTSQANPSQTSSSSCGCTSKIHNIIYIYLIYTSNIYIKCKNSGHECCGFFFV